MKIIRIKARIIPQPCQFRATCCGACAWCETHEYTEACVPLLQQKIKIQENIIIKRDDEIMRLKNNHRSAARHCDIW